MTARAAGALCSRPDGIGGGGHAAAGPGAREASDSRLDSHPGGGWRRLASATPASMIRHRSTALAASVGLVPRSRAAVTAGSGRQTGATRDGPRYPRRNALGCEGIGGGVHEATRDRRIDLCGRGRRDTPAPAHPPAAATPSSSASRSRSRAARRPTASRRSRARSSRSTRPTRPAGSAATAGRDSSRSTMPSTASTTSSRARRTCRPSSNDPAVIGVVGPYNSAVAKVQIPISNAAGLLQCSPANTNQGLTKPEFGGLDLRTTNPDKISLRPRRGHGRHPGPGDGRLRVQHAGPQEHPRRSTTSDASARASRTRSSAKFEEFGGTITGRVGAAAGYDRLQRDHHRGAGDEPRGHLLRWRVTSGGGLFLKQLRQAGLTIPFLGPDGIVNGSRRGRGLADQHRRRRRGGQLVRHRRGHRRLPGQGGLRGGVHRALQGRQRLQDAGRLQRPRPCVRHGHPRSRSRRCSRPTPTPTRPPSARVSAPTATDPAHTFDTVLGTTSFDENGDTTQPFISFYVIDPAAPKGGDWVFKEQQNFGEQLSRADPRAGGHRPPALSCHSPLDKEREGRMTTAAMPPHAGSGRHLRGGATRTARCSWPSSPSSTSWSSGRRSSSTRSRSARSTR